MTEIERERVITPEPADTLADIIQSTEVLEIESDRAMVEKDTERMGKLLTDAKELLDDIGVHFDLPIKEAHAEHRRLTSRRKAYRDPVEGLQGQLKRAISVSLAAQKKAADEANAEMRREAEKQAEKLREIQVEALKKAGEDKAATALAEAPVIAPVIH